jgi:hypothetical protein
VDLDAKHSVKSADDALRATMDFWNKTRQDWRDDHKRDEQVSNLLSATAGEMEGSSTG